MISPECPKTVFYCSTRQIQRESQSYRKQSWQAGQEYIYSRKTNYWMLEPKHRKRAATGWLRVLRTLSNTKGESPFFQPVKPSVFSALAGGLGAAPSKQFEQFSHRKKWANTQRCVPLCPACHN